MQVRVEFYVGQTTGDTQETWFTHTQEIEIQNAKNLDEVNRDELMQSFDLPGEFAFVGIYHLEELNNEDLDDEFIGDWLD
jgi:hypothetical protein